MLLVLIAVLSGCSSKSAVKSKQSAAKITIELTYKPYQKPSITKKYSVAPGTKLNKLMADKLNTKDNKGLVTSIAGIEQNKTKGLYWTYKIDGKAATGATKTVTLQQGQKIMFEMIKF